MRMEMKVKSKKNVTPKSGSYSFQKRSEKALAELPKKGVIGKEENHC
jgi:hypothetical protein